MLKMNMHIGSTLQLIFLPNYIRLNLHEFMIEPIDIIYSQTLRKCRQIKNVKQSQAYVLLKLPSQQEYSKLENGKRKFTPELIKKICEVFDISSSEFIYDTKNNSNTNVKNSNHTSINSANKTVVLEKLLKSKEHIILSQNETINQLKEMIELLKRKK
jgi:transcriptional regulator with XRE-family HTH domain